MDKFLSILSILKTITETVFNTILKPAAVHMSKFMHTTLGACIKVGGFFGWFQAVMYICRYSLHYYRDDSMLVLVSTTFLLSAFITAVIISVLLLFLDIEGILSNSLLRWLPGLLMAESGIALSLANAATMTAFAAVAGCAFGIGALAILTCLLRVRFGRRLMVIAAGLALSAGFRLMFTYILEKSGQSVLLLAAIAVGLFAALTIHSVGYSPSSNNLINNYNPSIPPIALAELPPKKLIEKIPAGYIWVFLCTAAFYAAQDFSETLIRGKIITSSTGYDYTAYIAYGLTALVCGLLLKFRHLPAILACSAGVAAASAALSGLSNVSSSESTLFAIINYAAIGVFVAGMYVSIVNLSVDKPHRIFYAMLGFAVISGGQLAGILLSEWVGTSINAVIIFVILMPVCGATMYFSIKREGLTQDKLDRFGLIRREVEIRSAEFSLSGQESAILRHTVLNGCDEDELAAKLLISRNTARAGLRSALRKLNQSDISAMREYFEASADRQEELNRDQRDENRKYKELIKALKEENNQRSKVKKEQAKKNKSGKKAVQNIDIENRDKPVLDIIFDEDEEFLPQVRDSIDSIENGELKIENQPDDLIMDDIIIPNAVMSDD